MRIWFFLLGACGLLAYTAHTQANAVPGNAVPGNAIPAQAAPPPSPGVDQCCDYQDGGTSGIHTYTCCNPGYGTCATTTFQGGATTNDYCDDDGNPTGGGTLWGACYAMPSQCPESMCNGATACQTHCSSFRLNRAVCWNWTRCFRGCMANQVSYGQCTRPAAAPSPPAPTPMGSSAGAAVGASPVALGLVGSGSGGSCVGDACSGSASCADGDCVEPTCSSGSSSGSGSGSGSCSCPAGYELVSP